MVDILSSTKPEAIRIFVASTPSEWLPTRVLEFSIRETSSRVVEVASLYAFGRPMPTPRDITNRPRTPFSFQRFLIPELCDYAGKAIYLDADMLVFRDIDQIWSAGLDGHDLQTVAGEDEDRRSQYSVMLLDCARLRWNIDSIVGDLDAGKLDYSGLMYDMRVANRIGYDIPPAWNSLERFTLNETCLLHYTDMNTQPWVSISNPLAYLWVACLRRALAAGFISKGEVASEVNKGHVRPSLLAQLLAELDDCINLPAEMRRLDRDFVPPYRKLQTGKGRPWTSFRVAVRAFVRRSYYRSPLSRIFR